MSSKECEVVSGQSEAEKSVMCNFKCQSAFKSEDWPEKIVIFALFASSSGTNQWPESSKKCLFDSFGPLECSECSESAQSGLIHREKASLTTFCLLRARINKNLGQVTLKIGQFSLFSLYMPIYRAKKMTICQFRPSRVLRMIWKCTKRANSPRKGQIDYFLFAQSTHQQKSGPGDSKNWPI